MKSITYLITDKVADLKNDHKLYVACSESGHCVYITSQEPHNINDEVTVSLRDICTKFSIYERS